MNLDQAANSEQQSESVEKTKASRPEFSLPPVPRNQKELIERLMADEDLLKIKAEASKGTVTPDEAKRLVSEGEMLYMMRNHLAEIGQDYVKEVLDREVPGFDIQSDEKTWTPQQKETVEWALDHAQDMPVEVILKRAEGHKTKLEVKYKADNERAGMKDLGLTQRRDLQAVDNLTALLKTYSPKESK